LATALVSIVSGCTSDEGSGGTKAATGGDCSGAIFHLDEEPNYSADYLFRWETENGCPVRLDVAMTRRGACFNAVDEILLGWPPLSVMEGGDARIFVRDPSNRFRDRKTADAYDPTADLPADAEDTKLRQDGAELWADANGDAIYLVNNDHTELWPLDETTPGCA
jgi:hypothetical protein